MLNAGERTVMHTEPEGKR